MQIAQSNMILGASWVQGQISTNTQEKPIITNSGSPQVENKVWESEVFYIFALSLPQTFAYVPWTQFSVQVLFGSKYHAFPYGWH